MSDWMLKSDKLVFFTDGNKICCVKGDFIDLVQSPAGFGDDIFEAMRELAKAAGSIEYREFIISIDHGYFVFYHKDYDGPEDRRSGMDKYITGAIDLIDAHYQDKGESQ